MAAWPFSVVLFSLGWILFGLVAKCARVFPRALSLAVAVAGLIGFPGRDASMGCCTRAGRRSSQSADPAGPEAPHASSSGAFMQQPQQRLSHVLRATTTRCQRATQLPMKRVVPPADRLALGSQLRNRLRAPPADDLRIKAAGQEVEQVADERLALLLALVGARVVPAAVVVIRAVRLLGERPYAGYCG